MSVGQPMQRDPEDDRRRSDLPRAVRRRRPRTAAPVVPLPPAPAPPPVLTPLARLLAELAELSTASELAAIRAGSEKDHASLLLLAQTARALHGLLVTIGDGGPTWDEGERLARMRRWLDQRAAHDPTAVRAAELCARAAAIFTR